MELAANEKESERTPRIRAQKTPPQDSGWLTTRKTKLRKYVPQFACVILMYCIPEPVYSIYTYNIITIIIDRLALLKVNYIHYIKHYAPYTDVVITGIFSTSPYYNYLPCHVSSSGFLDY